MKLGNVLARLKKEESQVATKNEKYAKLVDERQKNESLIEKLKSKTTKTF
mgnify:CR=1 FL=1